MSQFAKSRNLESKIKENLKKISYGTEDFTENIVKGHLAIASAVTQASIVEGMINAYIAEFYTNCPNDDYQNSYLSFIYDVLENKYISLNTKIDMLFKVFKRIDDSRIEKGDRKQFEDWLRARNIFAHGKLTGEKILYGGEFFDPQHLSKEFMKHQIKITAVLERYSELRGQYFNRFPIKEG